MRRSEINRIIDSYEPQKGFYDLSTKPDSLTKLEYAKILNTQTLLFNVEKNKDYYLKHDLSSFRIAQQMSAKLSLIIFEHWKEY